MDLNITWFLLLGVLLIGYILLDGFDLGVGIVHLWAAKGDDRRVLMNAIGPVWDGNEVWLVTFGGALFAAFPMVYATVFSTFYLAFMLLLFALIFRAASMEFRSKMGPAWASFWDGAFMVSSLVAALLFGVAAGNLMQGLNIDAAGDYQGSFFDLLKPYPIVVGLLSVVAMALHGSLYLRLKTEGPLFDKVTSIAKLLTGVFVLLLAATSFFSFHHLGRLLDTFDARPWGWGVVLLHVLTIVGLPLAVARACPRSAFLASSVTMATLVMLFLFRMFPNLVIAKPISQASLDIYNAASSQKTLWIMLIITMLGMPLVLVYHFIVYRTFRGTVKLDSHSY